MTSDDAAGGDASHEGTISDVGAVETGGLPATDGEGGEDTTSSDASAGTSGTGTFDDVLPESEYASNVGYETLQADHSDRGDRDDFSDSAFLTETSTSGVTPATTGTTGDTRRPAPSGSVRGDGSGTCPDGFPIKGNASSKIYHRPTDSSYQSTIPEFCFATEEDAKAAGFRARKG
jgi:large subunit ribosomal protein L17